MRIIAYKYKSDCQSLPFQNLTRWKFVHTRLQMRQSETSSQFICLCKSSEQEIIMLSYSVKNTKKCKWTLLIMHQHHIHKLCMMCVWVGASEEHNCESSSLHLTHIFCVLYIFFTWLACLTECISWLKGI